MPILHQKKSKMLTEKIINFQFKGNRTYVQGPDIYDGMLWVVREYIGEYPSNIKGSFHRLLNCNGICRIYEDDKTLDHGSFFAYFNLLIRKTTYQASILTTDTQISSSYEYNEEKVLFGISLKDMEIGMLAKSNYTYMEQLVAMTKKLHISQYPEVKGHWLFTKIQIRDVIDPHLFPGCELKVKIENNFHYRLTQSSIRLDNMPIGNIWFSLKKQENI